MDRTSTPKRSPLSTLLGLLAGGTVVVTLASVLVSQHRIERSLAEAQARPRDSEPSDSTPTIQTVAAFNAAAFRREMADMLDEKLRAAKTEPPAKPEAAPAPEEVTPERQAKIEEATTVVDRAVASHRWRESDRAEMAELLPALGQEHFAALMTQIVTAVNEGKLVKEFRGPPL
jgi:hypothetical protein